MIGERATAPRTSAGFPEPVALALAILAGIAVALQAYVNGKLAREIGSTLLASLLSFAVGLVVLLGVALARGVLPAALVRIRRAGRIPPWYFAGGLGGACLVASSTAAAPEIGVALVSVALVAGQTGGSLGVDAAGLGPAGRQPVSPSRLAGVGLAVVAVLLSVFGGGDRGTLHLGLLLAVTAAGVAVAFQQAANGQLQRISGDAVVAATVNFAVGTFVLLALVALSRPSGTTLAAPPLLYAGGLLGAGLVVVAAATVRVLGVLRLSLAAVAGQSVGAVALDAIDPAPGRHLTVLTVVGVAVTFLAVAVGRRP